MAGLEKRRKNQEIKRSRDEKRQKKEERLEMKRKLEKIIGKVVHDEMGSTVYRGKQRTVEN